MMFCHGFHILSVSKILIRWGALGQNLTKFHGLICVSFGVLDVKMFDNHLLLRKGCLPNRGKMKP